MSKTRTIAKNSAILYTRMLVIMVIDLLLVRIILKALGEVDYGIYNVVAGVITMLSFFNNVLSTAIQRFYSYSLASIENHFKLKSIFSSSINLILILSCIVLIIGETIGLWLVNCQLVIPEERLLAANLIYQFTIVSFILSLLSIPYSAAVLAHEDMGFFSIVSVGSSVLKLSLAALIVFTTLDKLIFYGVILLFIHIISTLAYVVFSKIKYVECSYVKHYDKHIQKEILSFSGWSVFGALAGIGMNQINTILLNIFFGPIINTARAIAIQVGSSLNSFCSNFILAIRPAMIKSYAENDSTYLNRLFYLSNKFIYYLLLVFYVPLMVYTESILNIWLNYSNSETILFTKLMLTYSLILSLNNPISIIIQATGLVKRYNIYVETTVLLCVPITYILFKMGMPAYTTFIAMIVTAVSAHIVRLICLKDAFSKFSYKEYLLKFLLPAVIITFITFSFVILTTNLLLNIWLLLFIGLVVSFLSILIFVYFLGLSIDERQILSSLMSKFLQKIV